MIFQNKAPMSLACHHQMTRACTRQGVFMDEVKRAGGFLNGIMSNCNHPLRWAVLGKGGRRPGRLRPGQPNCAHTRGCGRWKSRSDSSAFVDNLAQVYQTAFNLFIKILMFSQVFQYQILDTGGPPGCGRAHGTRLWSYPGQFVRLRSSFGVRARFLVSNLA